LNTSTLAGAPPKRSPAHPDLDEDHVLPLAHDEVELALAVTGIAGKHAAARRHKMAFRRLFRRGSRPLARRPHARGTRRPSARRHQRPISSRSIAPLR
jgi:hypothetical protein